MEAKPAMPDLADLELFDSCVTLGRFPGDCIQSAGELIEIMDRYRIAEALVHDYHARNVAPVQNGNDRLMKEIAGHKRLRPVWVLEPPAAPGVAAAERAVSQILDAGVRAARLCLRRIGAVPWLWEDLLARLEARGVATFFDMGGPSTTIGEVTDNDASAIYEMASRHPGLPIILSRVMGGLGVHPAVVPMIRRLPNVYIDITGILNYWRVVAAEAGPERVLFATGMPFTDPGVLVSNVQYAMDLDAAAKKLICGDNLRRLLGGTGGAA